MATAAKTPATPAAVKVNVTVKTKPRKKAKAKFPKAVSNILAILAQATPAELEAGKVWYQEAHQFCLEHAQAFNVSLEVVAGIVSALSPGTDWDRNKADSLQVLANNRAHGFGTYSQNVKKAFAIRDAAAQARIDEFFAAPKTFNFYQNILNPAAPEFVTIDRHALSVALGEVRADKAVKVTEYRELAAAYKKAAKKVGLLPADIQAVTWCVWRNAKGYKSKFTLADVLARPTVHVF